MVHCGTLCRAIPNGNRRADDIRPYELKVFERSAKYAPGAMRYVCVGEDIIFPLFPQWGNNVGAQRRQWYFEHLPILFGGTMSKHGICQHWNSGTANMVLPRNLPRWRADNIRPYADVRHRTWCVMRRQWHLQKKTAPKEQSLIVSSGEWPFSDAFAEPWPEGSYPDPAGCRGSRTSQGRSSGRWGRCFCRRPA